MPLSLAYWIVLVIWLVVGFWWGTTATPLERLHTGAWGAAFFLLFVIIGMKLFGAPLHS